MNEIIEKPDVQYVNLSQDPIDEISFPGQPKKSTYLALIRTGNEAKLIDLFTLTCTHRLQFDKLKMSLKFANYLPNSEQILTCFMDSSLHVWSTINMDVIRIINPIKMRNKRLQIYEKKRTLPAFKDVTTKLSIISLDKDLKEGYNRSTTSVSSDNCFLKSNENSPYQLSGSILAYCYPSDGSLLCFSTSDNYLLLISPYTFELIYLIYLQQFNLLQCALMSKPNDGLIFGLTNDYCLLLFDYHNVEHKVMIDNGPCHQIQLSSNGKILAAMRNSGELKLWSVQYVIKLLRDQQFYVRSMTKASNIKNSIPLPNFMIATNNFKDNNYILHENLMIELRKLLRPKRLQQILNEYQCFPERYRALIWCTILKLPYNHQQYQDLLNMGVPKIIQEKCLQYPLKDLRLRKALIKCWSNLAQWCKIFAYNDIIPHLIFPFVKIFHHNSMVAFEMCLSLIMNQFQLFFEYHPLEPNNYLAMCSNLLQYFDIKLFNFYTVKGITSSVYAWSILQNCFSEVLEEEQWLSLWDNILLSPTYQLIFLVVAYNQLQREVIIRLPDVENCKFIEQFFHEQNPIDVRKLIQQAQQLANKCPDALHPRRYIESFRAIPSGVYPKFVSYPVKNLQSYENKIDELEKIRTEIDNRMRTLEMEEHKTLHRLEGGLQREEHSKRMKTLEEHYQKILKREEERLNCQRKMLLLYQKEIHQCEREASDLINKSKDRKNLLRYERQFERLKNLIEREVNVLLNFLSIFE